MLTNTRTLCSALFVFVFASTSLASPVDSLKIRLESRSSFTKKDFSAHYLTSDQFGAYDQGGPSGAFLRGSLVVPYSSKRPFAWSVGADAVVNRYYQAHLQQLYAKARLSVFELKAGRWEETIGIDSLLSSGSLLQSGNAAPIPKITLAIREFTPVAFTNGWLEVKGQLTHGWMGEEREVADVKLHQKSLAVRTGRHLPVKLSAGLTHVALWGGKHPTHGQLPDSFQDYLLVFLGENGGEGSLDPEAKNALGNHLGVVEGGAEVLLGDYKVLLYNQVPFEDRSGLGMIRKDGLRGITIKSNSTTGLFRAFTYQYLSTRHQSGPSWLPPAAPGEEGKFNHRGNDNFYNNYLYSDGWTYKGNIIGSPLFHTRGQAEQFGLGGVAGPGVANNRIQAHHIGLEGYLLPSLRVTTFVTYSRNYGTYQNPYRVDTRREMVANQESNDFVAQWNLMAEVDYQLTPSLDLVGRLAVDRGELSNNMGFSLSLIFTRPVGFVDANS